MTWRVLPGGFVLAGFASPPGAADLQRLTAVGPCQLVLEEDETTVLLSAESWAALPHLHAAARCETDLRWIRFEAPMAWDVVGFLARVCTALATASVPVGAVCGYSRDNLFVAARYLEETRTALAALYPEDVASR